MHSLSEDMLKLESVRHSEQSRGTQTERSAFSVGSKFNSITERVGVSQGRLHVRSQSRDHFLFAGPGHFVCQWLHQWREIVVNQRREIRAAVSRQPGSELRRTLQARSRAVITERLVDHCARWTGNHVA